MARALRTGPFEEALATALDQSGLTLDRVRDHLAERGVQVSRATLSYWRRGRSRPERATSLDAVSCLEEVLGLPASSLLKLLGPRRARGRWVDHPPGTLPRSKLWPAGPILAHLAAPPDGAVTARAVHDVVRLAPDGSERSLTVRLIVEASMPGVQRIPVYYQTDQGAREPATLLRVDFGRGGRVVTDRRTGLTVAEIIFDHPLGKGERTMVEYEFGFADGEALDNYHRRFTRPVEEYALVVDFGGRMPARCHRFTRRTIDGPEKPMGEVWIGGTGSAQFVGRDIQPGIVGLRWSWS
ncbi:hypothetical protein Cs7R123_45660 [Catellatospora sp. TT07R-123]|nr:hypothetical protein Cs7R123_45660 [Catellatospora sp. TT07R-123]